MSGWNGETKFPEGAFALLENDGHNTPSIWVFRSQGAAERFLLDPKDAKYDWAEPMKIGYFDEESSWEDPDGTLWEVCKVPTCKQVLYVYDATENE